MKSAKNWTLSYHVDDKANFDAIGRGLKDIETRPGTRKYKTIKVGDTISFTCNGAIITKAVTKRFHWPSPSALIREINFKRVLPSARTASELEGAFETDPDYETMGTYGMFGFELGRVE